MIEPEDIAPAGAHHRPIRSFVLRQGRVSAAQQRALAELMPRWGIRFDPRELNFAEVFGREAPVILEIGFGMGETTATIAAAAPENNFLAIEVHSPGVGSLLRLIDAQALCNLRLIQHDAVEVLREMIPQASLAGAHVFFPDPWPKKRHHKRRLLQADFVRLLASRLQPGAYLHVATDWQAYAEEVLATLRAEPLLDNTAADFAPRPDYRPLTKFERRGLALGHGVWDLIFRRRS